MKPLVLVLMVLFLVGCATNKAPQRPINESKHQQKIANINKWKISGRLGFTPPKPDKKFSANVNWMQDNDHYHFTLSTPLVGTKVFEMTGSTDQVQLEIDDKIYTDTHPERLIESMTGYRIPVAKLNTWIKGQYTANDIPTFSANGLVSKVKHKYSDWQVSYTDYRLINEIWLPHSIQLSDQTRKIKIRINNWQIND